MDVEQLSEIEDLTGKTMSERRERLKKEIIKTNISGISDEFTKIDIQGVCENETDLKFGDEIIEQALIEIEGVYVSHLEGEKYEKLKDPKTTNFEEIAEPVWDEYKEFLDKYKTEGLSQFYEEKIKPAFFKFLKDFLVELTSSVEKLNGYEKDSIYTHHGSTDELLEQAIDSLDYEIPEEDLFKDSIEEYLKDPEEKLLSFIDECYTTAVNKDLLERENDLVDFPSVPGRNRKLILDTNTLVVLLADTDDLHPLMSTVCEKSSSDDVNFDLHYTSQTADELDELIDHSNRIMSGVASSQKESSDDNQLINDYGEKRDTDWSDYINELRDWRDQLEDQFNVTKIEFNHTPNETIEDATRRRLIEGSEAMLNRFKFDQFKHDWELLGTVARHRQYSDWSFGPFALTFDEQLSKIGREFGEEEEFDSIVGNQTLTLHPQKWLNYLIAFSSVDFNSEDREKFSMAVLEASSDFEDELDIDEYVHKFAPKVDVGVEDEEKLKELLLNHRLSEELEEAINEDEDIRAERVSREILTDREYLDRIEEESKYEDRIRVQESTINELEKEIEELRQQTNSDDLDEDAEIDESQFRTSYRECSTKFRSELSVHIRETSFSNPPGYQSDIEDIKSWLQNATIKLDNSDGSEYDLGELEEDLEKLLADAIRLTV